MNGHMWMETALKLLILLIRIKFFFMKFQPQKWIYKIFIINSMLMSKRCDHLPCMRIVCHVYSNTQHRKNPHHYPEKFGKFLLSSLITSWHETPEVRWNWKMIIAVKLCENLDILSTIWLKDAKRKRFPKFFPSKPKVNRINNYVYDHISTLVPYRYVWTHCSHTHTHTRFTCAYWVWSSNWS